MKSNRHREKNTSDLQQQKSVELVFPPSLMPENDSSVGRWELRCMLAHQTVFLACCCCPWATSSALFCEFVFHVMFHKCQRANIFLSCSPERMTASRVNTQSCQHAGDEILSCSTHLHVCCVPEFWLFELKEFNKKNFWFGKQGVLNFHWWAELFVVY